MENNNIVNAANLSNDNIRTYTLGQPFMSLDGLIYIYHGKALHDGEEYDSYAELVEAVHDLPYYNEIVDSISDEFELMDVYDDVVVAFAETAPFYGPFSKKFESLEDLLDSTDHHPAYNGWESIFLWKVLDIIFKQMIVENVGLYLEYNPLVLEVVMREYIEDVILPDFLFSGEYFSLEQLESDVNWYRS